MFNSSPLTSAYKKEVKWYAVDLITVKCARCEIEIMKELIESGIICQFKYVHFAIHPTLKQNKMSDRYCESEENLKSKHTPYRISTNGVERVGFVKI